MLIYHATNVDLSVIKEGSWFSTDPVEAAKYLLLKNSKDHQNNLKYGCIIYLPIRDFRSFDNFVEVSNDVKNMTSCRDLEIKSHWKIPFNNWIKELCPVEVKPIFCSTESIDLMPLLKND